MLILWFVLGYALFAVAFGAAGALVSRAEDAQSTATPITLIAVAGFFAAFQVVDDPTSAFATIASYVPVTAPFVVPIRFAFKTIPWWEITLSVAVMSVTIVLLIRMASRVYSGGLLHFGGRMKYRDAYRSAELA
jgi:ABC-2 type transport system permease protein